MPGETWIRGHLVHLDALCVSIRSGETFVGAGRESVYRAAPILIYLIKVTAAPKVPRCAPYVLRIDKVPSIETTFQKARALWKKKKHPET